MWRQPRSASRAGCAVQLPNGVAKARSRELTRLVDSFSGCHDDLVGTVQRCTVVDTAADGVHLVGHTKCYAQVSAGLSRQMHALQMPYLSECTESVWRC